MSETASVQPEPAATAAPLGLAKPLFLIGAARSGTTALAQILDAHPRIVMTNETAVFLQLDHNIRNSRLGVNAGIQFGKTHHKLWADHLRDEARPLIERYYARIARAQSKTIDPDAPEPLAYFGEKHPHLSDCLDFLDDTFPEARYVHIVRDPRDSALSIAKMTGLSFEQALEGWLAFDNKYAPFVARIPADRVYDLHYEALVADYNAQSRAILDWLGLDMHDSVRTHLETFAHTDSHTLAGSGQKLVSTDADPGAGRVPFAVRSAGRWKWTLTPEQAAFADELVGDALHRYGYEHAGTWTPKAKPVEVDRLAKTQAVAATPKIPSKPNPLARVVRKLRTLRQPVDPAVIQGAREAGAPIDHAGRLAFTCNVCAARVRTTIVKLGREIPACPTCRSTARMRAMIHLLSLELFAESHPIDQMPSSPRRRVLGLNDWAPYAERLARKLAYTNTFSHDEPRFDPHEPDPAIAGPGSLDAVLASDVFNRLRPPIARVFENLRALLKPGASLIATVPFRLDGDTAEHFPDLHNYHIEHRGTGRVLVNTTADGKRQVFDTFNCPTDDVAWLETRVFSQHGLTRALTDAGFEAPEFMTDPYWPAGVRFEYPWSIPFVARTPK